MSILIIEDDETYLQQLTKEFKELDIKTDYALDGEIGVQKAQEILPELIILDLMLPKKLGITVLEEIRNTEAMKNTPVIVISSFSNQFNESNFQKLGIKQFILKADKTPHQIAEQVASILE